MRLLIVEDEDDLRASLTEGLRMSHYAVDETADGEEALYLLTTEKYDLLLLDLNLPKVDGFTVLKQIRETNSELKILILSAKSNTLDKVHGLDLGANDYLTKPFDFIELEARIRNLLRRNFTQEKNQLTFRGLTLNISEGTVLVGDESLELTRKEFSILRYFLLNRDKIISQEELLEHIWDNRVNQFSSSIRVHIASLRKKLHGYLDGEIIGTKVGVGYYLVKEREPSDV